MKILKIIFQKIRRHWCKHSDFVFEAEFDIIWKYKKTKKGRKLRFDIWEKRYCPLCGKLLEKKKVKSDLTETQMRMYIDKMY